PAHSCASGPDRHEIPAFPPRIIVDQSHDAAIGERRHVNFGRPERQRSIPKGGEQRAFAALAQAIGALAAHPGSGGRLADAAGAGERVEKPQLALGAPAVPSTSLSAGAADFGAGLGWTKR